VSLPRRRNVYYRKHKTTRQYVYSKRIWRNEAHCYMEEASRTKACSLFPQSDMKGFVTGIWYLLSFASYGSSLFLYREDTKSIKLKIYHYCWHKYISTLKNNGGFSTQETLCNPYTLWLSRYRINTISRKREEWGFIFWNLTLLHSY
jgi:hypothetical protein